MRDLFHSMQLLNAIECKFVIIIPVSVLTKPDIATFRFIYEFVGGVFIVQGGSSVIPK